MTSLVYAKFTTLLGNCKDMEGFVGEGCIQTGHGAKQ